jgi:ABC-type branched-subunit amino acid transport system permease subunit
MNSPVFRPERDTRQLLLKWIVALLVPVAVFTFVWSGEEIVNNVLLNIFSPQDATFTYTTSTIIQASIFIVVFYPTVIALAGYLVAADSGHRGTLLVWLDIAVIVLVPLLLIIITNNLIIGMALCALVWVIYFVVRARLFKAALAATPAPLADLQVVDAERRVLLMNRAVAGGFWFATIFAVVSLIADLIFFFSGSLPTLLLIWALMRTILLPILGYFLGRLAGVLALRRVITPKSNGDGVSMSGGDGQVSKVRMLETLSASRAREEAKDLVPNDLPMRSTGAQRFYIVLLLAFVLLYPVLDPILFGSGINGRLSGYGDAGYYVILALGLNIVVGFAGLLDLGYVAFFAIGAYSWALVGSTQFTVLTSIAINPQVWGWLFWPMLLGAAIIAAFWGVVLGVPTLRLRGDYLAIVTLGFGEIIPIVFQELDKYTNGVNGIPGVLSPKFFGLNWSIVTPIPYYYLILALIALLIFVNIRLRDSRLGRAWVAIREDEIAASSSGINLVNTKLFAFGAGAFFSGVAGAYHTAKLGTISPDAFSSQDSIIYLAMVVIGGIGSIPGVIVGAFVVYAINEFILSQLDTLASDPTNFMHAVLVAVQQVIPSFTFGNIRNLLFGIILVTVMIFRPEGLIPSARRRRELHRAEAEAPEEGALDVVPGAPGFEEEVHVD